MRLLTTRPGRWLGAVLTLATAQVLAGGAASLVSAQGLSISPQRIILEGRQRSAEVLLINPGNKPATYRVYLTNKRMREDGTLEEIKKPGPGERFASPMIRYSPRVVTVTPSRPPTVRLLVRPPRDLPAGEYMSRMVFETVPPPNPAQNVEAANLKAGEISVSITPIFAMTIPVIFRNGKLTATGGIAEARYEPADGPANPPALALRVKREGNRSLACDVTVTYFPQDRTEGVEVASLRRLTIYAPTAHRSLRVPLAIPDGVTLGRGRLFIVLRDADDSGQKVLDQRELTLK